MPVQQHVLNWLYSVLTSEYHDVNRTYNDVGHVLTRYPSLAPRTDVHTFPNGTSALLLHLTGTIPVSFRGSTYRFPISIWVPHAYPRGTPLIYVTPTENMMIRPGQHVDPQGLVYHPYLVGWAEFWDKSTLHDFLAILSDVFAKEPPVISREQPRQARSPPVQAPPPVPPLSLEVAPRPTTSHELPQPPPPPPKTAPQEPQRHSPTAFDRDGTPPASVPPSTSPPTSRASRYTSAPPLPPEAQSRRTGDVHVQPPGYGQYQPNTPQHSPHSHIPPISPMGTSSRPHGPPEQIPSHPHHPPQILNRPPGQWHPAGNQQPPAPPPPQPRSEPARPPQPQPAPAPPDLLDEPLTLDLPGKSTVAAPPIPPNPEKDALLRKLAQTLASLRQRSRQQNESSMAGLQAQRSAILSILPTVHSEMAQLTQLSSILTSNTAILHDALHKADGVIEGSRSHPAPDIDELLVAPTVVANQLYTLVAEERALGDAVFMLGRAVERGRISPAVFAKMTRSLAREWYLKKALVRKIGLGMGLAP